MDLYTKNRIDSLSIDIQELQNNPDKSYHFLLDNSLHIEYQYKDVLEAFYRKVMLDPFRMGDYNICPEYGDVTKNYRFRFMIVKDREEYILLIFKVVDPRTASIANYFTLGYEPISLDGGSALPTLRVLQQYESIKSVVVISEEKGSFNNNYFNMLKDFKEMDKSTWRSKNGVNKLAKIIGFSCDENLSGIYDGVETITAVWNKVKHEKVPVKYDTRLLDMAMRGDNIKVFTFWYNGIMVAFSLGIEMLNKFISLETTRTINIAGDEFLTKYLHESDPSVVKLIRKHLGAFVQYSMSKYCLEHGRYEAVYYYGDGGDKGLREFKRVFYKNIIFYTRVPMADYIKLQEGKS